MSGISQDETDWAYWPTAREVVRVLRSADLWGRVTCEVLVPSRGQILHVDADELEPAERYPWTPAEVTWRAAAARALHLMAAGQAVALSRGDLEPLPHQLAVLERALASEQVRLLLADEVGLGKTIEAGLIYTELKARGRAKRVLVVAPKGVQLQWVAEMSARFQERFVRIGPGGIPLDIGTDAWRAFHQVVCSLDAVKPVRTRAGWSPERVAEYNERRFRAVVEAGWDLVILDEAHHVAGSTEDVARHRLARELAARTPHVLLLSATPHSGKTEAFARLLGLLEPDFFSGRSLSRETVRPLVVRTEKRYAVDQRGDPLFRPRTTGLEVVPYGGRHVERALYDAVTDYVRHGYNRAKREKRPAVGFLVLLMQRLVSSSTEAIRTALERRAAALAAAGSQLRLFAERAEEWAELTGEEQYEALAEAQGAAWGNERAEVELLLDLARKAEAEAIDAKATHLLDLLRRLQREENDPSVKVVVFTEFVPTQEMLLRLFDRAGIAATSINGSMNLEERAIAQETFRGPAQVLVSTDAGGEGINLQFAHVVVNYDLPWNPMRIEQRIGRVDRIGQRHIVRAFNLVLENSVDARVLEVLERKLWRILEELGADKWGDVLESASPRIEHLYAEAVVAPERLEADVATLAEQTRADVDATENLRTMLGSETSPRPAAITTDEIGRLLRICGDAFARWSGDETADELGILARLPEVSPGASIPRVAGDPAGMWTLWEVRPNGSSPLRDFFALFLADDGTLRPDLAERFWVELGRTSEVVAAAQLDSARWSELERLGHDHAYRAFKALAPDGAWQAPWLSFRLAVRVEP